MYFPEMGLIEGKIEMAEVPGRVVIYAFESRKSGKVGTTYIFHNLGVRGGSGF